MWCVPPLPCDQLSNACSGLLLQSQGWHPQWMVLRDQDAAGLGNRMLACARWVMVADGLVCSSHKLLLLLLLPLPKGGLAEVHCVALGDTGQRPSGQHRMLTIQDQVTAEQVLA